MTPHGTKCSESGANGNENVPEAGAPEIELTDEMIEAGVAAYYATDRRISDADIVVINIVRAALAALDRKELCKTEIR